jgi:probable HAF family extracellular repeat protein
MGLPDSDNDGVPDDADNCPNTPNPDQADADLDLIGDVCEPSFTGVGDLPGGSFFSQALAVSADGSTVVGPSSPGVFRWTSMDGIGPLDVTAGAFAVSGDGSVIVGGDNAYRWTEATGQVVLGDLPGGLTSSVAYGVSTDGSVVVGKGTSEFGSEAFRWTQAGGMVGLGDLPGGSFFSEARGVSADGSVVVGWSNSTDLRDQAFRWTEATGMVGLGFLPGRTTSMARGVSADGSVVVGESGPSAFRWTDSEGMVALVPMVDFGGSIRVLAVSGDGSMAGGSRSNGSFTEAYIWDASNGFRFVKSLLETDYGLDLTGWILKSVRGLSADGRIVIGTGLNPIGAEEGWIAVLAPPQDADGDGIANPLDNCPDTTNPDQLDVDADGVGNACNDADDSDGDEWADALDTCPNDPNPLQEDTDADMIGDLCDPFPLDPDNEQAQCELDFGICLADLDALEVQFGQCDADLTNCQDTTCDLDGNSMVNLKDTVILRRILAGAPVP